MTPDRAEAAAVMLESLAAHPTPKLRAETSCALLWIPLTHPLRWIEVEGRMVDRVLAMAEDVKQETDPEVLLKWAAEIRAGAAEMRAAGWYPIVLGGVE